MAGIAAEPAWLTTKLPDALAKAGEIAPVTAVEAMSPVAVIVPLAEVPAVMNPGTVTVPLTVAVAPVPSVAEPVEGAVVRFAIANEPLLLPLPLACVSAYWNVVEVGTEATV